MKDALRENRVDLHLQPIVNLPQRRVCFYEGFTRLRRPDGKLIMPAEFMAAAERAKAQSKRATGFLVEPDPVGLAGLCDLIEAGHLEVKVDQVFDLAEAPAAHRAAEDHHGGGKIVLRVP